MMDDYSEGIFSENIGDDQAEENHHESVYVDFLDAEVVVDEMMLESNNDASEKAAEVSQTLVLKVDLDPSTASSVQENAISIVAQSINVLLVDVRVVIEAGNKALTSMYATGVADDSRISHLSSDVVSYERLHEVSKRAHQCVVDALPNLLRSTGSPSTLSSQEASKKCLCSLGRELYSLLRDNPLVFRDSGFSLAAKESRYSGTNSNISLCRSQDPSKHHQGACSAYVRYVSGILVLIDCISYTNLQDVADQSIILKDTTACEQLTFGLATFLRAGRAMMNYAENPSATYDTLSLALIFWKGLQKYHEIQKQEIDTKHVDDAFDAYSLLPDAAYLVYICHTEERQIFVGSPIHVRELIDNICDFLNSCCLLTLHQNSSPTEEQQNPTISLLCIQRFLPTLARLAYKHGNRLARENDYENAKHVLSHALRATNRCVVEIKQRIESFLEENVEINHEMTPPSLHVQQQEMVILAKESLYVFAYINQATNMTAEAHECLDRIQIYISDQCKRDEELYQNIMGTINKGNADILDSKISSSWNTNVPQQNIRASALLLGPKRADEADIRTRAHEARAAAKYAEAQERANLAFTRLMIYNRSSLDEEEGKRDEQLDILISLISSCSKVAVNPFQKRSSEDDEDLGEEIFELALTACRFILIKRLTELDGMECSREEANSLIEVDPYGKLAAHISFSAQKNGLQCFDQRNLIIMLDCVKAVLSSRQIIQDKIKEENSVKISLSIIADQLLHRLRLLDKLALEKANSVTRSLQEATAECQKSLHAPKGKQAKYLATIIQECRGHFSRMLDVHRLGGSPDLSNPSICIGWADLILQTTSMLSQIFHIIDSINVETESSATYRNDLISAEVMAIKALSMASSGMFQQGLTCGRVAWEKACEAKRCLSQHKLSCCPSTGQSVISSSYNLAALFHCTLLSNEQAFSATQPEVLAASDSVLLELEDALSNLSNKTDRDDIVDVFPTLLKSCTDIHADGTGVVQLGIKLHWISLLMGSGNFLQSTEPHQCNLMVKIPQKDQVNPKVLSILLDFLYQFENLFEKYLSLSVSLMLRKSRSLVAILDELLNVFITIRDRYDARKMLHGQKCLPTKSDAKTDSSGENSISSSHSQNFQLDQGVFRLIWDSDALSKTLGTHQDCVCLAEQLWNTASLLVINIETKVIAAELFAKAHDFALLSEEEEGKGLSRGFLDFDFGTDLHSLTPFINKYTPTSETDRACDLSSEFSAHCLLLAVASVVDTFTGGNHEGKNSGITSHNALIRKSIRRLESAYFEIILNRSEDHTECDDRLKHLIVLLAICCIVETGDDIQSMTFLLDCDTMKYIYSSCAGGDEDSILSEDSSRTLAYLYSCSQRAEANRMRQTSWTLLHLTCCELVNQRRFHAQKEVQDNLYPTLGTMQQKLIKSAPSVEKALTVFSDVNKALTEFGGVQSENSTCLYSGQEMDWFTVESYNRGINLVFLGDLDNSERLITLSLNFLQHCTEEVKLHGPEMRNGYRGVMERKDSSNKPSVCSNSVVRLFSRFH